MTTKIILIDRSDLFERRKEFTKFFSQILLIRPSIKKFNENSISIDDINFKQMIRNSLLEKQYAEIIQTNRSSTTDLIREFNMSISKEMKHIEKSPFYYYFDLDFEGISLVGDNVNKILHWSKQTGFKQISNRSQIDENQININLRNKTLRVTTIVSVPYVIYNEVDKNGVPLIGNDRFSGMAIDILKHLSKMKGFLFKLHLVKDGKFGYINEKTGEWNGMIGELVNNKADLAVSSIVITYQREQVVDFTTPWMTVGITAVTKSRISNNFLLMSSFSTSVWCMLFFAYLIVSLTLFIIGRISPYEWKKTTINKRENSFTLSKSFWYTIGFVKRNDNELLLRAVSTRLISTIWWIFIIIIIASYSANLVKVFFFESNQNQLRNFEDLAYQSKIKYGTLYGGSTYSFFKNSKIKSYKKMWNFMQSDTSVFVKNVEEGIQKVLKGNYAFILESTMNEYFSKRNCDLLPLSGSINSRGYSFGLRSGNTNLRDQLSEGILQLEKDDIIEQLRYQWFENDNSEISCPIKRFIEKSDYGNQLDLDAMSYLFYLLLVFLIISSLIACYELLYWACSVSSQNHNSACDEIGRQIKRAFNFGNSTNDNQLMPLNEPSNSKETPVVV